MKTILPKLLLVVLVLTGAVPSARAGQIYRLRVKYKDCLPAKLMLYEFDGLIFKIIQTQKAAKDSTFLFEVKTREPVIYFVGQQPNVVKPVIFGLDKEVWLAPHCRHIAQATFAEGTYNHNAEQLFTEAANWPVRYQAARSQLPHNAPREQVQAAMKKLDDELLAWNQRYHDRHAFLGRIADLMTYPSFINNTLNYHTEVDYFAEAYFRFADFKDPVYERIPMVADAFRNYTATLNRFRMEDALKQYFIEEWLAKIPPESRTYKNALGGIVMGFRQKNKALFEYFANMYIKKFAPRSGAPDAGVLQLQRMLQESRMLDIGAVAPDFALPDRTGKELKPSDFRGKVLLLDFWASWCGPCRREIPNVKRAYEKYHDKGFEVLGISLDRRRAAWLKAMDDLALPWPNISDVKGWQCAAAKLYQVRSIPATFLLDRDGRIIAKGLRGPLLEAKLKAIFGE